MIVKSNETNFEQCPVGTHLARCIGLIDVGTHTSEWKGNPIRRRQLIVKWELPLEQRQDGQPFVVSEFYTRSLSEKANLRQDLVRWRGRDFTQKELEGFDLKNILDKGCQVTITEKENGKIKVSGVTGLPKGVDLPERHNELIYFDLDYFDEQVFDGLTEGLQKLIRESEEYQAEFGDFVEQAQTADAIKFPTAPTNWGTPVPLTDDGNESAENDSVQEDDDIPF